MQSLLAIPSSLRKVTRALFFMNVSQRLAPNFETRNSSGSQETRSKKFRSFLGRWLKVRRRNKLEEGDTYETDRVFPDRTGP
jgi:hypothetical protein